MASSNISLFGGDDDDSSDSDNNENNNTNIISNTTSDSNEGDPSKRDNNDGVKDVEDESQSHNDSNKTNNINNAKEDKNNDINISSNKENEDDDDDDDDEDAEFNDDDVIGRTKNEREIQLEQEAKMRSEKEKKSEITDYLDGSGENEEYDKNYPSNGEKPLSSRKFSVLDIPRPIPSLVGNKTQQVSLHMTKLPNIVNINIDPYDKDTYLPEEEEKEYNGFVHNMIRWRYKKNPSTGEYMRNSQGKLIRESNSRVVKWSDGSMTLHVGTEIFEIDSFSSNKKQPIGGTNRAQFPGMNGYLYLSQKATLLSSNTNEDGEKNVKKEESKSLGTVLECMGSITSKLIPRPSITSEAHKNLTLAVHQRNMKKSRIAEYVTQVDPEQEKNQRIKNKDDLNRSQKGKRPIGRGGYGAGRSGARHRRPNRRFYNDDPGHFDSVSIRQMKHGIVDDVDEYGQMRVVESDSEDDEWRNRKRYKKRNSTWADESSVGRAGDDDDEDDDNVVADQDSESDEDFNLNRKRKSRGNVFDDEDE